MKMQNREWNNFVLIDYLKKKKTTLALDFIWYGNIIITINIVRNKAVMIFDSTRIPLSPLKSVNNNQIIEGEAYTFDLV